MKKILLFCLLTLLLIIPSFAETYSEEALKSDMLKSAETLSQILSNLEYQDQSKAQAPGSNDAIIQQGEELQTIIEQLESQSPQGMNNSDKVKVNALSPNSIFVTNVSSAAYQNAEDLPLKIKYTYYRPSDGAVFTGTLSSYYLKMILPKTPQEPLTYQTLYEGTLTLNLYVK